jgi:2-amino-4-hydroxy-6-hydroxymethyldihydropteridine diphosphokinase
MIFVGLGANLPSPMLGPPRPVLEAALAALPAQGITVAARSRWYESAPVPVSDQPWYVNGVARVETDLAPAALLAVLHEIERQFGRVRRTVNEARILDLDLLAYDGLVEAGPPVLPHPRLHERAFVLLPLRDVAPDWRHPVTGATVEDLLRHMPPGQVTRLVAE